MRRAILAAVIVLTLAAASSLPVSGDETEAAQAEPVVCTTVDCMGLAWPVTGVITSPYGPRHPLGIDIAIRSSSVPVASAAAGIVVYMGGEVCCGYGFYIIVDHGGGIQTLYAHLSRIYVSIGQAVEQGHVLGTGGTTGNSTGPHLHFELRKDGMLVNPMSLLP